MKISYAQYYMFISLWIHQSSSSSECVPLWSSPNVDPTVSCRRLRLFLLFSGLGVYKYTYYKVSPCMHTRSTTSSIEWISWSQPLTYCEARIYTLWLKGNLPMSTHRCTWFLRNQCISSGVSYILELLLFATKPAWETWPVLHFFYYHFTPS